MSCGEAHETDCSEVLAEVWLLLDHECGEERDAQLRRHLAECGPCLARYGLEEKVKTLLARSCSGDRAPDTLHQKLRERIRATVLEQAQVTVERTPAGGTVVEVNSTRVESWRQS
jgi:mycothiol system anti-sigma-R factor